MLCAGLAWPGLVWTVGRLPTTYASTFLALSLLCVPAGRPIATSTITTNRNQTTGARRGRQPAARRIQYASTSWPTGRRSNQERRTRCKVPRIHTASCQQGNQHKCQIHPAILPACSASQQSLHSTEWVFSHKFSQSHFSRLHFLNRTQHCEFKFRQIDGSQVPCTTFHDSVGYTFSIILWS